VVDSVIFMIGIIVANVPEGLLATVTVSLTITAQRMASKNVLVKNTQTVETLGSITVICSDKTGTLTQNRMTVRHAIFNSSHVCEVPQGREKTQADIDVSALPAMRPADWHVGIHPVGRDTGKIMVMNRELHRLIVCGALCNHAIFLEGERQQNIPQRKTSSDPSEGAILKFCHSHFSVYDIRANHKEVACIPFSSAAKWMVTIHEADDENSCHRLVMKGAPERVLERCSFHGDNEELTADIRREVDIASQEVARNGERVIAFAELVLDAAAFPKGFAFNTSDIDQANFPLEGLRLVGMLAMEDPPREEVPAAVQSCREAGIQVDSRIRFIININVLMFYFQVVMVTGDHPLTARSIATQVGILPGGDRLATVYDMEEPAAVRQDSEQDSVVVVGSHLSHFDDSDWEYVLSRGNIVFARTLPQQKQAIVMRLQARNHVVAVTGDGVNGKDMNTYALLRQWF
jgi:magnesium-transporting ATPase (P-type)